MSLFKTDKDLLNEEKTVIKLTSSSDEEVDFAKKIKSNGKKAELTDRNTYNTTDLLISKINTLAASGNISEEEKTKLSKISAKLSEQEDMMEYADTAARSSNKQVDMSVDATNKLSLSNRLAGLGSAAGAYIEELAFNIGKWYYIGSEILPIFGDGLRRLYQDSSDATKAKVNGAVGFAKKGLHNLLNMIFGDADAIKMEMPDWFNDAVNKVNGYINLDRPLIKMTKSITKLTHEDLSLPETENDIGNKPFVDLATVNNYLYEIQDAKSKMVEPIHEALKEQYKKGMLGASDPVLQPFLNGKRKLLEPKEIEKKKLWDFINYGLCTVNNGVLTFNSEIRTYINGIKDKKFKTAYYNFFDALMQEYLCEREVFNSFTSFDGKITSEGTGILSKEFLANFNVSNDDGSQNYNYIGFASTPKNLKTKRNLKVIYKVLTTHHVLTEDYQPKHIKGKDSIFQPEKSTKINLENLLTFKRDNTDSKSKQIALLAYYTFFSLVINESVNQFITSILQLGKEIEDISKVDAVNGSYIGDSLTEDEKQILNIMREQSYTPDNMKLVSNFLMSKKGSKGNQKIKNLVKADYELHKFANIESYKMDGTQGIYDVTIGSTNDEDDDNNKVNSLDYREEYSQVVYQDTSNPVANRVNEMIDNNIASIESDYDEIPDVNKTKVNVDWTNKTINNGTAVIPIPKSTPIEQDNSDSYTLRETVKGYN